MYPSQNQSFFLKLKLKQSLSKCPSYLPISLKEANKTETRNFEADDDSLGYEELLVEDEDDADDGNEDKTGGKGDVLDGNYAGAGLGNDNDNDNDAPCARAGTSSRTSRGRCVRCRSRTRRRCGWTTR